MAGSGSAPLTALTRKAAGCQVWPWVTLLSIVGLCPAANVKQGLSLVPQLNSRPFGRSLSQGCKEESCLSSREAPPSFLPQPERNLGSLQDDKSAPEQ